MILSLTLNPPSSMKHDAIVGQGYVLPTLQVTGTETGT